MTEFIIYIVAKPSQSKTEITGQTPDGAIKLSVGAPAYQGKANQEIIKFFKKRYKLNAEIVSGKTNKKKKIRLFDRE